ncbi:MAG TPA: hypothetical protein VME44_16295 [Streptosporangiaceae bacterium]|nr:hypothetical protein [Streptosporangiaceae bacterium]
MRRRARRRHLVVWSQSAGPADWYSAPRPAGVTRGGRVRRVIRLGALLAVMGLLRLARGERARWRPLLAGVVLVVVGIMLRGGSWGALLLAGFWCLLYALLVPDSHYAERQQRRELKRELAVYSTAAQRRDLEATLDRYPDGITSELRDILANRTKAA